MKRVSIVSALILALPFGVAPHVHGQSPFTGTWITYNFVTPTLIDLQVNGNAVTGTVGRAQLVVPILDGSVTANTITFRAVFQGGARAITYTGHLDGDDIAFTRSVEVRAVRGDGAGIFGSLGPMEFTASRDQASGVAMPRALLGNWRLDLGRSTFDPGPAPNPAMPDVMSVVSRPGGRFGIGFVSLGADGGPAFTLMVLRADGRDHPVHTSTTLAAWLGEGTPTRVTRSFLVLGDRAFQMTGKTNGVVTATGRLSLSADGATLTEVVTNVNARGETLSTNTYVWERAPASRPMMPTN